jgi:aspartyl aminopeptidase
MTLGKGSTLGLGLAGAVALGVWIGPHITHRGATVTDATAAATQVPAASVDEHQTAREARRAPASKRVTAKPASATVATKTTSTSSDITARTTPAAAPALHELLKPLLNKGADMGVASQDFADAEQFAAVAHAARNTEVPFMVLKHRIVKEGKSLEDAIREFKPDLNAAVEAERARAEAKSDISALEG